jgi:hypothetical protein
VTVVCPECGCTIRVKQVRELFDEDELGIDPEEDYD